VASVSLVAVSKAYAAVGAVDGVSLDVESGRFLTLLGPSGCGKSTTLRLIAGLVAPDRGEILIDTKAVTTVPTHQRRIGMVFQSLALFPHMTVAQNIAFGLRMQQVGRAEWTRRVAEAIAMVKLTGLDDRLPKQLSGGQQQRVALARALVTQPRVLLLDEPFAALDRKLRLEMQGELRELIRRTGTTAVFVTHDQEEALVLSDRIAVMNHGRIEQIDAPSAVFDRPANAFVADFMGATNLFVGRVEAREGADARILLEAAPMTVLAPSAFGVGASVTVAIRPEAIGLGPADGAARANRLEGTIESVVYQGTHATFRVRAAAQPNFCITARLPLTDRSAPACFVEGDRVWATWGAAAVHVMPR
jgi:spermidine/putrescine ABC transporter ATP-binding subunit